MAEPEPTPPRPGKDDIDPELVALRRPRAGVGPLLVAAVVGLSAYLMIILRADLRYWLGAKTPAVMGDARRALVVRGEQMPDNAYVTLTAMPDRSAPARLRGKQDTGHRLAPALGTSGHLWIQVGGEAASTAVAYDERYTGRLRRLGDVAFHDELAGLVAATPPLPRPLDAARLARPGSAADPVTDAVGDVIAVTEASPVELDERVEGVALVTVVRSGPAQQEAEARAALVTLGVFAAPGPAPVSSGPSTWTYEAPAPAGLDALRARSPNLIVAPKYVRHATTWGRLAFAADAITVGGARVPLAAVEHLAVWVRPSLPADALILLEGEAPDDFWYVPVIYALLAVLSAIMVWAFVRSTFGADKPAPASGGDARADPPV